MVATAKLRRAKTAIEQARPYADTMARASEVTRFLSDEAAA